MKQSIKILLSGGGTGGHIYPAIAIANQLKQKHPNAKFLFVGASDKMEMLKVPQAGFDIKDFKPNVVVGTGGFASGPILQIAVRKGIPTLIQEQNSFPGITNKLLSKQVDKICVAYDGLEKYFPKNKIIKTGNPVRQDILNIDSKRQEALKYFKLNQTNTTLLVLGGSLGARTINKLIETHVNWFTDLAVQVIWQTGKFYNTPKNLLSNTKNINTHIFINKMDLAYAAADIIISRAGASTISELCIVGKPVIFIPSPNVAEDHQTKNAKFLADKQAAILLKESEIKQFENIFKTLLTSKLDQQKYSKNIKQLALPNATKQIANTIELLLAS